MEANIILANDFIGNFNIFETKKNLPVIGDFIKKIMVVILCLLLEHLLVLYSLQYRNHCFLFLPRQ
jgi:hypothetical protein